MSEPPTPSVAEGSPLEGRMLFVVGARRSGTLWVQRILAAHPAVASIPTETYLFSYGISQVFDRLQHGLRSSARVASIYAERRPVIAATRRLCDEIFTPYANPEDAYLVERTPWHAHHLRLIAEIYPDARILHIIRDGRDVARSLAAQPWGADDVEAAASEWRDTVCVAQAGGADNPGYREARYELLLADPAGGIRELYEWLGLETSSAALALGLEAAETAANLGSEKAVGTKKWRRDWSRAELAAFHAIGGDLLEQLGYDPEEALGQRDRVVTQRDVADSAQEPPPRAERPDDPTTAPQRQLEDLTRALIDRDLDSARGLFAGGITVRVIRGGQVRERRGTAGIALLRTALGTDPAFSGRRIADHSFPAFPRTALHLVFQLPNEREESRTLLVAQGNGLITELTLIQPS